MTFISYAQNFEDLMLWRALKEVDNGFYIDVGAAWPDEHSVTKAFYYRGWHGINLDPNPTFHSQLQQRRPRDINLRLAVGDHEGTFELGIFENTGLSTLDKGIAALHQQAGRQVRHQPVQVSTLKHIWQQYVPPGQTVHFLKIDAEGFEEAVLQGMDWENCRPWVVIVEATLPMSKIESHQTWEPLLLSARYQLVYADGLNRFYVENERIAAILPTFKYPPNVFDDFKLSNQVEAEAAAQKAEIKAQQAEVKAQQAEVKAQQAEVKAQQAEVKAQQLAQQFHAVCNSKSWRVTAPLRWLSAQTNRLQQDGWIARLRALVKKTLRKLNQKLLDHPHLRQRLIDWSHRLGLYPRLKSMYSKVMSVPLRGSVQLQHGTIPTELGHLTPRARQIYAELKRVVARHQKEQN